MQKNEIDFSELTYKKQMPSHNCLQCAVRCPGSTTTPCSVRNPDNDWSYFKFNPTSRLDLSNCFESAHALLDTLYKIDPVEPPMYITEDYLVDNYDTESEYIEEMNEHFDEFLDEEVDCSICVALDEAEKMVN